MSYTTDIAVITYLQTTLKALTAMRGAPARITDSANIFPFAVSICRRGDSHSNAYGDGTDILTFASQIHIARAEAMLDYTAAMHFRADYRLALLRDTTLGGTVDTIQENGIRARFAVMKYGSVDTIGWDVEIDVKAKFAWS